MRLDKKWKCSFTDADLSVGAVISRLEVTNTQLARLSFSSVAGEGRKRGRTCSDMDWVILGISAFGEDSKHTETRKERDSIF